MRRWWFRAASSWREPLLKAEDASRAAGGSRSAVVVATGVRRRRLLRMARAVARAEGGWVVGTGEWWERSVEGSDRRKVATEADAWKEIRRGRPSGRLVGGRVTGATAQVVQVRTLLIVQVQALGPALLL